MTLTISFPLLTVIGYRLPNILSRGFPLDDAELELAFPFQEIARRLWLRNYMARKSQRLQEVENLRFSMGDMLK